MPFVQRPAYALVPYAVADQTDGHVLEKTQAGGVYVTTGLLFHGLTADPSFSLHLESSPQDMYDYIDDILQRIKFQIGDFCHHKLTVSGE
ncbi:MAG: hypothetical protein Kow0063_09600 [Anaerolineae bacterium]